MRPCDPIHELPTLITLGRRPLQRAPPPEAVLVSFAQPPLLDDRLYFHFPMEDSLDPSTLPARDALVGFLESLHPAVSRQASYWHCRAGINRSPFGLAAYLHLFRGLTISDAIELIRARRDPCILGNPLFEATLHAWFEDEKPPA